MASVIVDRRVDQGKSAANRKRLLRRLDKTLRRQLADILARRKLSSMDGAAEVKVSRRQDLSEPTFTLDAASGTTRRVLPGNADYRIGDRIPKPPAGEGEGAGAGSGDGDAEDDFRFLLSREEFLALLFEDLALPELLKKELTDISEPRKKRGGVVRQGTPSSLSVLRTLKASLGRRVAADGLAREEQALAEEQLRDAEAEGDETRAAELALELEALRRRKAAIPFIDPVDLRHRSLVEAPAPRTAAVMFCLMDVSGSMTEECKDLAKRFFTLLYLFLSRKYEKVELVFIRHTDEADEVDEETFFNDPKSGGTRVLAVLQKMREISTARFPPSRYNIFGAHVSDGDSFGSDPEESCAYLQQELLPMTRYFVYSEARAGQSPSLQMVGTPLWSAYGGIRSERFNMAQMSTRADVYPALAKLFDKQQG